MRSSTPIGFLMTVTAGAAAARGSTRRSRCPTPSRIAVLAVAAAGLGLLTATPAAASPAGSAMAAAVASGPTLTLSIATGPPTTATKAKGAGFPASDPITVTFDGTTVATTTSGSTGTFTAPFTVPAPALPGPHTVAAFDSAGVGASATFTVQTNWATARFSPSGSGFNPYENVLGPANVGQLTQVAAPQWGAFLHSEPSYVGGELIVGSSDGTVREFDPSGDQRWSFSAGGAILGSPTAVIPNEGKAPCAIVAGSGDGNIYGLSPTQGTELWKLNLGGGPVSGELVPAVQFGPKVVVTTDGGAIAVVNGCTGTPAWAGTLNLGSAPPQATVPAVLRHVTLAGGIVGTIIVVSTGAGTFGVNASDGALVWSANDPCTNPPCSVVGYGTGTLARVVIGNGDPTAVELNAGTGQQIWSHPVPATLSGLGLDEVPVPGSPGKFTVRSVIVGDTAGDLDSLNPRTGVLNWGDKESGPIGQPAVANGVIYDTTGPTSGPAGTSGQLIAVNDGTGQLLFSADTGDLSPQPYPPAPPTVADGRVYTGDFTGGLRVFALPG